MKLSIITVNLNNRDGLKRTIDSVVHQTLYDFEWIVIDGGSTDHSKELIESYAAECPVLLNTSSCFPEIASDSALYFSFEDSSSLCVQLETVFSSQELENLIRKQLSRLQSFSWHQSAVQLLNVYQSIV